MTRDEIYSYLVQNGYQPFQAQALVANIQAESSFNPLALNRDENAHGLIQWRGPRLMALQEFARQNGTSINDPITQLKFIGAEMTGSEASAGAAFRAATDLPSANAALEKYIRYANKGGAETARRLSLATGQPAPTRLAMTMTGPAGPDMALTPQRPLSFFERLTSPEGLALGAGGAGALAALATGGGGAPDPALAPERLRVPDMRQFVPELPMPSPMLASPGQALQPQGFDALPGAQAQTMIGNPHRRRI